MTGDIRKNLKFEPVAARDGALFPHHYGPVALRDVKQVWQLSSQDGVFDFAGLVT